MSALKIIGIASGKGGVGKTTVSSNLAVALAQAGNRVMLFDGDLGLANVQLALGIRPEFNFGHVISGEKTFNEIVIKGPSDSMWCPVHQASGKWQTYQRLSYAGSFNSFRNLKSHWITSSLT